MFFDISKLTQLKAPASEERFAKLIFDNRVIKEAPLSMAYFTFKPGQVGPRHVHQSEVEVYLCTKGRGMVLIEDEPHVLTPDTLLYIPPRMFHETKNIGDENFEFYAIFGPMVNFDNIRAWEEVS